METVGIRITDQDTGSVFGGGAAFKFWTDVELVLSMDRFDTVGFTAPFESDRAVFRRVFRPFSFRPMTVEVNDLLLFTGTLVGVAPDLEPESKSVSCTGYALPGVLEDCTEPGERVPQQYDKMLLKEIATKLAEPFDIGVVIEGEQGARFDKVELEAEKSPHGLLVELAKQRNNVLTNTPTGDLLIWKSVAPGNPVTTFVEGTPPFTKLTANFSPQAYFSQITGFSKARLGKAGSKHTELNPWLQTTLRPRSISLEDTDDADAPAAVRAQMGRMFGNIVTWEMADIPGWRNAQGDLWQPNTTVMVTAPSAMIYRETELLIREVSLKQSADSESATLQLVLPGAFSGEVPEVLPWDE